MTSITEEPENVHEPLRPVGGVGFTSPHLADITAWIHKRHSKTSHFVRRQRHFSLLQ